MKSETENKIIRFLNQNASIEDIKILSIWLDEKENQKEFENYVKLNFYSIYLVNKENDFVEERRKELENDFKKIKIKQSIIRIYRYAAVLLLFFGLGYYQFSNSIKRNSSSEIIPKKNEITLEIPGGKQILIEKEKNIFKEKSYVSLHKNSNQIIYKKNNKLKEIFYHTLNVPYGKTWNLILSDGTKVYLNSGSSLKYPVSFIEGLPRTVFLNGEAFFEVKNNNNNNIFEVYSNGVSVEVYGTKFNFKNFIEDDNLNVVLVEGSVQIKNIVTNKSTKLSPGFMGSVSKKTNLISKTKVNTKLYTSWVNGRVIFRNEKFDQIIKKLERLYNVTIINNNKIISGEPFNASFDINSEPIDDVLGNFKQIYDIDYQISNNKIIIN